MRFKVRGKWTDRQVACRIAMCLGIGNPLAWEAGDQGAPFWREGDQKWQIDSGNNYWLRKVGESPPDEKSRQNVLTFPVREFELTYRYDTEDRKNAIEGLCQWLESDLVFGS